MNNIKLKNKCIGQREVCDAETGELVPIPQFRLLRLNSNFVQTFLPAKGIYMLKPKEFTATDHHMLDYFYIIMDKSNKVYSPVSEIMERLDISQPTVYRSVTELRRHDFIRKKGNSYYMVNPEAYCKCDGETRSELLEEYAEYDRFGDV